MGYGRSSHRQAPPRLNWDFLSCSFDAFGLLSFTRVHSEIFCPLLFLGVVALVAIRLGNLAGILGTIAAALIFVGLMFEPRLSLAVHDSGAKSSLIWMLVAGIAMSELLEAPLAKRN